MKTTNIYSIVAAALIMGSCGITQAEKSNQESAMIEMSNKADKRNSVQCISKALESLHAAESQGSAKYALKHIKTSYNMLNKAVGILDSADSQTICGITEMSEQEANLAMYITVSYQDSSGLARKSPSTIQLNTAPIVKNKPIETKVISQDTRQANTISNNDPLLPSSRWKNISYIQPKANTKATHKRDSKILYVQDNTFYRGINKAKKGNIKGLSQGHDSVSEYVKYIVKKGDTLWWIAKNVFSDAQLWPDIYQNNPKIKDPDVIYPKQKLVFRPKNKMSEKYKAKMREKAVDWDRQRQQVGKINATSHKYMCNKFILYLPS